MMDRARAAHLIPRGLAGDEAEQVEDIGQRDHCSGLGEVNARHGRVFTDSKDCTWQNRTMRQ
jgi:hypothetical protein